MARFDEIEIFLKVMECRNLTRAADSLAMPIATVSRKLTLLERRMGIALLNRSTHGVVPTEAGRDFYAKIAGCYQTIREAELDVRGQSQEPAGTIRISTPYGFGQRVVEPAMLDFARKYPKVSFAVLFDNRMHESVELGVDLAVRLGRLHDSTLFFRRLGSMRLVLTARPDYLVAHGMPQSISELSRHKLLTVASQPRALAWSFTKQNEKIELPIQPTIVANDPQLIVDAVIAGIGIARIAQFMIEPALHDGRLQLVLPDWTHINRVDVSLLYPRHAIHDQKVRLFLDFLSQRLLQLLKEEENPGVPVRHGVIAAGARS